MRFHRGDLVLHPYHNWFADGCIRCGRLSGDLWWIWLDANKGATAAMPKKGLQLNSDSSMYGIYQRVSHIDLDCGRFQFVVVPLRLPTWVNELVEHRSQMRFMQYISHKRVYVL